MEKDAITLNGKNFPIALSCFMDSSNSKMLRLDSIRGFI